MIQYTTTAVLASEGVTYGTCNSLLATAPVQSNPYVTDNPHGCPACIRHYQTACAIFNYDGRRPKSMQQWLTMKFLHHGPLSQHHADIRRGKLASVLGR